MKIVFSHVASVQSSAWFQLMSVNALVEPDEEAEALAQGFLYAERDIWYQCRSTRLEVAKFSSKAKWPKGYTAQVIPFEQANPADLERISQAYLAHRGWSPYSKILNKDTTRPMTVIMVVNPGGQAVAFTLMVHYKGALESMIFCWDYSEPKISLGKAIQELEIDYARRMEVPYLYLGVGCESSSIYKAKWPGFEWWTGAAWSTDVAAYTTLCQRDDRVAALVPATQLNELTNYELL